MTATRLTTPRSHVAWVSLLFLVSAAMLPFAALIVDSGRDLAWGWSIAQGLAWPSYGPSLNGLWQPGPVWYYALAVALALTGSIGATAALVGVAAALKIPLAYALGREWSRVGSQDDPSLGLCVAAAIALPGWSTVGQLALSHTTLVEALVAATLWLALRAWRDRRALDLIGGGLVMGLALHAHPTALVAAPALALAAWRVRPRAWLPTLLAFALPLLPALVAEARSGWPQFDASRGYFGASDYGARALRAPTVLAGASAGGVGFVREFLLGRWPGLGVLAALAMGTLYLGSALGLLLALRRDRAVRVAIALAGFAWGGVLLLRDSTPAWMVYACAPFDALLLGLGWHALWRHGTARGAAVGLASVALLLSGAAWLDRVATARSGVQWFPSAALADIAQPLQADPPQRFWLPAFGHDAAARHLCGASAPTSVHGDLATALHFGQGVAAALHCRERAPIRFGGGAARRIAGVPNQVAEELGLRGERSAWGYTLLALVAHEFPPQGPSLQVHTRYLMDDYRERSRSAPVRQTLDRVCNANEVLVVTNLLPGLNTPFEVRALSDATTLAPRVETLASRYFACPSDGRFSLELQVLDSQAVDVFVLAAEP